MAEQPKITEEQFNNISDGLAEGYFDHKDAKIAPQADNKTIDKTSSQKLNNKEIAELDKIKRTLKWLNRQGASWLDFKVAAEEILDSNASQEQIQKKAEELRQDDIEYYSKIIKAIENNDIETIKKLNDEKRIKVEIFNLEKQIKDVKDKIKQTEEKLSIMGIQYDYLKSDGFNPPEKAKQELNDYLNELKNHLQELQNHLLRLNEKLKAKDEYEYEYEYEESFIGEKKIRTEIKEDYQEIEEMSEKYFKNDNEKQKLLKEAQDLFNKSKQTKDRSELDRISHRLRAIRDELFLETLSIETIKAQQKRAEKSGIDKEVVSVLKEEFNITEEELEKIEGFSQLSKGQQFLVLENLKQWVLGEIQTKAIRDFEQKKQEYIKNAEDNSKLKSILYGARTLFNSARLNLAKGWKIKKFEKINKDNIKEDKQREKVKQALGSLVEQVKRAGIEVNLVETKQGKKDIEIQYLSTKQFKGQDKIIIEKFNKAATNFSKIPALWGTESYKIVDKSKYVKYNQIKKEYEEIRGKALNILNSKNLYNIKDNPENKKAKSDDMERAAIGEALKQMNEIDMNVKINQFLNTNPEVEEALLDIDKSAFKRALGAFFKSEKGMAITSGILSRYVAKTALLFGVTATTYTVAMPIITITGAAGFGAWRGRVRGKEDIKIREKELSRKSIREKNLKRAEREKSLKELSRLEEEMALIKDKQGEDFLKKQMRVTELKTFLHTDNKITKERNFVDAKSLTDKIALMIDKIDNSESEEQRNKLINSLKVRINYTKRKIEEGLVNFGNEDEIINNTYNLTSKLSNALNYIGEYSVEEKSGKIQTKGKLEERISKMLDTKSLKITEQQKEYLEKELIKGMLFSLGFVTIGMGISMYFDDEINKYIDKPIKSIFDKIRIFIDKLGNKNLNNTKSSLFGKELGGIIREHFRKSKLGNNIGQNQKGIISQAELSRVIKEHFKNENQTWNFPQTSKANVPISHSNGGASIKTGEILPAHSNARASTKLEKFWQAKVDKGDSPLKIAKNIYKEHAQDLGYKGNIQNHTALDKWAEKASARHIVGQYISEHSDKYNNLIESIGRPPKNPAQLDDWLHKVPKSTFNEILNKKVPNLVFKGDIIKVGQNGDISAFDTSHNLRTGHINIVKTINEGNPNNTIHNVSKAIAPDKPITFKQANTEILHKDVKEMSFLKNHPEFIDKPKVFNELRNLAKTGRYVNKSFSLSDSLKYYKLFKGNLDTLKIGGEWNRNQIEILQHLKGKGDYRKILNALKFVKDIRKNVGFKTVLAKLKINPDDKGALEELKKLLKIDNIKNVRWSNDGNKLIARINKHFWFDKDKVIFSKN